MEPSSNLNPRTVVQGSQIMVGAPAQPMPETLRQAVIDLLCADSRVIEAHLPQLFVPELMAAPAQAIAVVLKDMGEGRPFSEELGGKLTSLFADSEVPPIVPMARNSEMLDAVRAAGCCVKVRRPFWKLW